MIKQMVNYTCLDYRGVVRIAGSQARGFLQGLITNDMNHLTLGGSMYGGLLSPQGKLKYDIFIVMVSDNEFWLDCHVDLLSGLVSDLKFYKLRSDIDIIEESYRVIAIFDDIVNYYDLNDGVFLFTDPRLPNGKLIRGFVKKDVDIASVFSGDYKVIEKEIGDYNNIRLDENIPEIILDFPSGKFIAAECRFEEMNGISFSKGCFVGQEVSTRVKRRNMLKKIITVVDFNDISEMIIDGFLIVNKDGDQLGEILSRYKDRGFAMLKLAYSE